MLEDYKFKKELVSSAWNLFGRHRNQVEGGQFQLERGLWLRIVTMASYCFALELNFPTK